MRPLENLATSDLVDSQGRRICTRLSQHSVSQVSKASSTLSQLPKHWPTRKNRVLEKPLCVMKFGGTSVGDANSIGKVLEIVRGAQRNYTLLVVVSAMARVTDLLIEAGMRSANGDLCVAWEIFLSLKERHESAARSLLHSALEQERYESKLQACLLEGEQACREAMLARELTPPVADLIASLGERLCAPLVAAVLRESQVLSESIDAQECIVTDARHGGANPDLDQTRIRCEDRLRPLLRHGVVPVVTGFLGATPEGTLTTLGRGGSDYSASIVGAALSADEVIIWTDVDGFLTSDPRLISDARTIPQISYRQAAALAYFGAKVLHPKTLQPLVRAGIPVWIRNTFAADRGGTKITLEGPQREAGVKALTAMRDVSLVTVTAPGTER